MRRIVTGVGADGRATVIEDGEPRTIFGFGKPDDPHVTAPERLAVDPPDVAANCAVLGELWATNDPVPVLDGDPTAGMEWDVECPPGATRFRIARYGPHLFAPLHRTNTLDYDVVLAGSITLLLEDGSEVAMGPGDAVVIPGIVHGWRTGDEGCTKVVVMTGLAAP